MSPDTGDSLSAPPASARARLTPSGEILSATAPFLALMGFDTEGELREGVPRVHDLFAEHRDRGELEGELARTLSWPEVRWIRRDGTSLWVRIQVTEAPEGREGLLEIQVEDVTGRRHLEAKLRQAEKMEALGQLAGGMSHDLNNLFTTLLSRLDLLEEGLKQGDDKQARQELMEVRRSATTASQMIRHLLSFSRGERLNLRRVGLEEVVRDSMRKIRPLLPDAIQVETVTQGVEPVLADPGAVEQMLLTLVANARDAMPDGGELAIRVGPGGFDREHLMHTGWGDPGDYGLITVVDNGEGIPPQVVSRLFQPFFAARSDDDRPGLSMSMVYGIMKQHRGFIEVESEPGEGTAIRLYFRLADAPSQTTLEAEEAEEAVARSKEGHLVLFVEDDASLRRVTGRVLRSRGYRVMEAAHGLEALEVMDRVGMPDLLLTDLVMPSMTGIELVERLTEEDRLPRVLLTSGYAPDFLTDKSSVPLDHPFLPKPWTVESLVHKVREALQGKER